jgi:DNA-binding NtrC family response regulator
VILARSSSISPETLPIRQEAHLYRPAAETTAPLVSLEAVECEHIRRVLASTGYHKSKAAEILGISRKTLDRKIVEYGLAPDPPAHLYDREG